MWVCSGSPLVAEICAGSGLDWLLIDAEHSPNGLESILAQLHAVSGYPVQAMVRPPVNDTVVIKQYLDLGVQNLLIPMVNSASDAAAAVAAIRYPPHGVRGVGSALARSARWNRVPDYLASASETISLTVQIESEAAASAVEEILAVDGVDGIFLGPSDLAASMGLLGQQEHPEVRAAVEHCLAAAKAAGKPAGVNAFNDQPPGPTSTPVPPLCWSAPMLRCWPARPRVSPQRSSLCPRRPSAKATDLFLSAKGPN